MKRRTNREQLLFPACALICIASLLPSADSTDAADLVSGNATATIADNDATMTVWRLDDDPDNVFISNFYFRTDTLTSDNGGEVKIAGLGPLTITPIGSDFVQFEAADSELSGVQTWSLTGGSPGSGDSTIESVLTLTNLSARTIPLSLYYASDFDIAFEQGNPNDETTPLSSSSVRVFDPVTLAQIVSEVTPDADSYQVYEGQFEVLFNFNSDIDGPTTLTNTPSIGSTVIDSPGVTDAGFAFGWTIDLAPGESISATATHVQSVIPEPSSIVLIAGGLLVLTLHRLRLP